MRIRADISKCEAYANCIVAASDVFTLNDANAVEVLEEFPAEDRRAEVEDAVRSCPTQALVLEG